jgi:ribosomal protein L37E
MSIHDTDDDEDWYDSDDDELDEEETARCPECGQSVHIISGRCPACGYWLSEADRRAMWSNMSKPLWLRVTALVVLVTILLTLLTVGAAFF